MIIDPESEITVFEHYAIMGVEHRDGNQPSHIERNADGRIIERHFRVHGELHRTDGPALELYDRDSGALIQQEYWVNGRELPEPPNAEPLEPI